MSRQPEQLSSLTSAESSSLLLRIALQTWQAFGMKIGLVSPSSISRPSKYSKSNVHKSVIFVIETQPKLCTGRQQETLCSQRTTAPNRKILENTLRSSPRSSYASVKIRRAIYKTKFSLPVLTLSRIQYPHDKSLQHWPSSKWERVAW